MNDKDRIDNLEEVLAQFLRPIKNLPFHVVVKALSGSSIIAIDMNDPFDFALVESLKATANRCAELVKANPIVRNRPNEVGNDIEPFVIQAAASVGLRAVRPTTQSGANRSTGYPDVLVYDQQGRPTYLECKVYGEGAALTTMRSFYLSPSEDFKVALDARHILMAFGVTRRSVTESINSEYVPSSFKLVDLHGLLCDVKYEFNSDNRRLYANNMLLAQGVL